MQLNYEAIRKLTVMRLEAIEEIALEDEDFNNEWKELKEIEASLLRLLKIPNQEHDVNKLDIIDAHKERVVILDAK